MKQVKKKRDSLGRATFHHITPQDGVVPTAREILWLKHIERHGPQNSVYLHELTKDTHRCKDTSRRQLQKLRAGGYFTLPHQQRSTERAEFNHFIYDLTQKAREHLIDLGIAEPTVRPTGHWWHGYMTSCITGAIDIAAARERVRYIPAHEILAIRNAPLAIPVGRLKLIPDQLFGLDYGGRYRVCVLEVDRGTEPKTSPTMRKSYASSIELYRLLIERGIYRSHYGLKANLLVLWVFSRRSNEERFLEMVDHLGGKARAAICTQVVPPSSSISKDLANFYGAAWSRCDQPDVVLANAE